MFYDYAFRLLNLLLNVNNTYAFSNKLVEFIYRYQIRDCTTLATKSNFFVNFLCCTVLPTRRMRYVSHKIKCTPTLVMTFYSIGMNTRDKIDDLTILFHTAMFV